jgi:hypothetical protein
LITLIDWANDFQLNLKHETFIECGPATISHIRRHRPFTRSIGLPHISRWTVFPPKNGAGTVRGRFRRLEAEDLW